MPDAKLPSAPPDQTAAALSAPLRWWQSLALGLLHAVAMLTAFPPGGVWPAILLAPAPIALAAAGAGRRPLRTGLWFGLGTAPFWAISHAYLWQTAAPAVPLLIVYLSLYPAVAVWLVAVLRARGKARYLPLSLFVPLIVVALEMVKAEIIFDGYAFHLLYQPLIDAPLVPAAVSVLGPMALSWLVAAVGSAAVDAHLLRRPLAPELTLTPPTPLFTTSPPTPVRPSDFHRARASPLVLSLGVPAGLVLAATLLAPTPAPNTASTLRVAIIQTDVPQSNKDGGTFADALRSHQHALSLTRAALEHASKPELVLWPETSVPGLGIDPPAVEAQRRSGLVWTIDGRPVPVTAPHDSLLALHREFRVPFIVGSAVRVGLRFEPDSDGRSVPRFDRLYNSAILIEAGQVTSQRYDKVGLMAFGEYVPYLDSLPALRTWLTRFAVAGWNFVLSRGSRLEPLVVRRLVLDDKLEPLQVATPICIEGTMGPLVRRLTHGSTLSAVRKGPRADIIAVLTNDGWFYDSDAARRTHLLIHRWRCVETGLPMARAANTGISAAVDRLGRLVPPLAELTLPGVPGKALIAELQFHGRRRAEMTPFGVHGEYLGWSALVAALALLMWPLVPTLAHRFRKPAAAPGR